jgi:hypothetical protein
MIDETLIQLKILVERVVRPVRAAASRKRKMREELLAHVTAVYEEEAKTGDASMALERTAQRFGTPAELTSQLQAAAPATDKLAWWIDRAVGAHTRESALRRAFRISALVGGMCTAGLFIMILVIGRWHEWLTLYRLPAILSPVYMAVLTFFGTLLALGMRQAMFGPGGRSWPRILILGVASWLLVPGVTLAWCCGFTGDIAASLAEIVLLFLTGLLAPITLIMVLWLADAEIRYLEEWASLKIDAETRA